MSGERLHVYSSPEETEASTATENVLILSEELSKVDRSEYRGLWGAITRFGNAQSEERPVLQAVWPYIVYPGHERKGSLLTGIILLERVRNIVDEGGHEAMVPHGVEEFHRAILRDISKMTGTAVVDSHRSETGAPAPLLTLDLLFFF
jgi:hypothetical protein